MLLFIIIGMLAAVAVPNFKKYQDKAKLLQQNQNISNEVSESMLEWVNPVTRVKGTLPEGFKIIAASPEEKDTIMAAFTTNSDLLYERLIHEEYKTPFKKYVELLYQSKIQVLGKNFKLSEVKFRKMGEVDLAEFSFVSETENIKYLTTFKVWSYDNLNHWHLMSSVKEDDEASLNDSERLLAFMLNSSKL